MTTQLEVNWDHVKDVVDEISKEIINHKDLAFYDEDIPSLYGSIRRHLTDVMDFNHDGWPVQELVEGIDSPQGIPAELARVVIHILNFCRKRDIDLSDAIKAVLEGSKI